MTEQARADANAALVQLRYVALVEGLSYLLLLFVGMPLKYGFHIPQVNRVLGMMHGLLTLIFFAALLRTHFECRWPFKRTALAIAASLIPFGAVWLDRTLKDEIARPPRG